jgi:hypothetical protein
MLGRAREGGEWQGMMRWGMASLGKVWQGIFFWKGSLMIFKVSIRGKTALLLHRFPEDAQEEASSQVHSRKERLTPRQECISYLYLATPDDLSSLYFPAENLRQCIVGGGKRFKIGRASAMSDLAAAVFITPEHLPLKGEWEIDTRPVVIPTTQGRILRHRPKFVSWSIDFLLEFDLELIQEDLISKVLKSAGNFVGIGDYRPACKGPFGRFEVVKWEEQV